MSSEQEASQITAYSYKPFIDLTPEESKRLSPMTRNAKNVIYVTGFLANTKMNKNNFRISDNKYLEAISKGLAAGKPINYGPKILGKAHHPNFYQDLDISGKTDAEARADFLQYQEWSRIGDMFRMSYDKIRDRWIFNGAISHPNVVEAIQNKTLELPKYVSPYFWNLNNPEETGSEIREAELFHVSFVDDPAYGPEAVAGTCNPDENSSICAARVLGMPAAQVKPSKVPCACGLMASINHKLDSSFYVESPNQSRIKTMSDQNNTQKETPINEENKNPNNNGDPSEEAKNAALSKMKEYDKLANEGKANLDKSKSETNDPKNPTIPVEYQEVLNMAIEKERKQLGKQHDKAISEYTAKIESLEKEIAKRDETAQDAILNQYIERDFYKNDEEYNNKKTFYKKLAQELKMPNDKLEELMKDHYQVKELKISVNTKGENKGKGAGSTAATAEDKNLNPFGFDNDDHSSSTNQFGLLQSGGGKNKGIGAGTTADDDDEEDTTAAKGAAAIIGAFSS